MLYFGAVDCQYALAGWSESVGSAFIRCARGRSKRCPALNVTHAPMLRCCMRANQNAKGAIWRSRGSTAYRAPTGRRRLNESCVGKHIETCKKIKNVGKRNRNSKGHRSMATSKNRGREICQSRCDLRTNAAVRHVKRMMRSAEGVREHINI